MTDCLFCKIIKGDIPAETIGESEHFICFLDIKPINKGHALIAPKQHFKDFTEFPESLAKEFVTFAKDMAQKITTVMKADSFNLSMNNGAASGQVIFHQHTHIIPRYNDDGLKSWPHKETTSHELKKIAEQIQ